MNSRLPVFLSYAHEDESYLNDILTQLRLLKDQDMVCAWSDLDIAPGSQWANQISNSIANARACVLLISPDFLASQFIRDSELPELLDKCLKNELPIIPVMVRPCLYELAEFKYPDSKNGPHTFKLSSIQAINSPDQPLSSLPKNEQEVVLVKLGKHLFDIYNGR